MSTNVKNFGDSVCSFRDVNQRCRRIRTGSDVSWAMTRTLVIVCCLVQILRCSSMGSDWTRELTALLRSPRKDTLAMKVEMTIAFKSRWSGVCDRDASNCALYREPREWIIVILLARLVCVAKIHARLHVPHVCLVGVFPRLVYMATRCTD